MRQSGGGENVVMADCVVDMVSAVGCEIRVFLQERSEDENSGDKVWRLEGPKLS